MFESTLSAQGPSDGERRFGALSAAVVGHLAVVFAILGASLMMVPPVKDPGYRLVVAIANSPPLDLDAVRSSPPPPKKGTNAPKPGQAAAAPRVDTEAPLKPPTNARQPDAERSSDGPDGPGDGPVGVPGGSDTGVSDGHGPIGSPDGNGSDPVYVTGDMVSPKLLVKVEPAYPEVARIARLGGRVTVKAVIGLDGNVESAEIFSSTSPLFNRAALDAVTRWRYRPALMNGKPIRVFFTVMVAFSLR